MCNIYHEYNKPVVIALSRMDPSCSLIENCRAFWSKHSIWLWVAGNLFLLPCFHLKSSCGDIFSLPCLFCFVVYGFVCLFRVPFLIWRHLHFIVRKKRLDYLSQYIQVGSVGSRKVWYIVNARWKYSVIDVIMVWRWRVCTQWFLKGPHPLPPSFTPPLLPSTPVFL